MVQLNAKELSRGHCCWQWLDRIGSSHRKSNNDGNGQAIECCGGSRDGSKGGGAGVCASNGGAGLVVAETAV